MLIMLIGPKGSGKSHVGRLLESAFGVHFFHVEPYWMKYHTECAGTGRPVSIREGIDRIHPLVASALKSHQHVCIETTGASPEILQDLRSFGTSAEILLVKIEAPWPICLQRIATRDSTNQIPLELEETRMVYELSVAVDLPFDITLKNISLTEAQILQHFADLGLLD